MINREEITKISKEFAEGLGIEITGSGWLVVDPLSGYLNACGFKNTLHHLPETDERPLILIMQFEDGSKFVPSGSDIPIEGATNWLWINP